MMQFKEFNVKSILALFIIVFGMCSIVFLHLEDMVLGALIGFIGQPLQFFFGSSKGSEAKDQTIKDMSKGTQSDVKVQLFSEEEDGGGKVVPPKAP